MTVAVMVKVQDGVVLAADSATSLRLPHGDMQVWNNANKVFQLHREVPLGAMTWGRGSVDGRSIASHAKELRWRFQRADGGDFGDWRLDPKDYTVEGVANRMAEYFDPIYQQELKDLADRPIEERVTALLGFLVAGYSANEHQGEAWLLEFVPGQDPIIRPVAPKDATGWGSYAQPAATHRLFNGADLGLITRIRSSLQDLGEEVDAERVTSIVMKEVDASRDEPALAPMPFADAIALARFLVDVTIGYTRFVPGSDTVGGPVDVASLSFYEGFRWIERKLYYPPELNQESDHR